MPDITIRLKPTGGTQPVEGASYFVKRYPYRGSLTDDSLLSTRPEGSVLNSSGEAMITLPESPFGTRYVLVVREHGSWQFKVGTLDGFVHDLLVDL